MCYEKLSLRRKKFVDAYLTSGNATQAAKTAGYSPKTAYSQGLRLLKKEEIRAAIDARLAEFSSKKIADSREVLEFLTSVMRGEITEKIVINTPAGRGKFTADLLDRPPLIVDRINAAKLLARLMCLDSKKSEGQEVVIYLPANDR